MQTANRSNTLSNVSLGLGIASAVLVFGLGFCALVGLRQGWIAAAGTALLVCGATSAFLGLIGAFTGLVGLVSGGSKATAAVGLLMSAIGVCLFFVVLGQFRG